VHEGTIDDETAIGLTVIESNAVGGYKTNAIHLLPYPGRIQAGHKPGEPLPMNRFCAGHGDTPGLPFIHQGNGFTAPFFT
jgi:hypothetical protein